MSAARRCSSAPFCYPSATLGPADRARSGLVPSGPAWTRSGQAIDVASPVTRMVTGVSASERSPHFYAYYGRFGPISADSGTGPSFVPNPCRGLGPFLQPPSTVYAREATQHAPYTPPERPVHLSGIAAPSVDHGATVGEEGAVEGFTVLARLRLRRSFPGQRSSSNSPAVSATLTRYAGGLMPPQWRGGTICIVFL